MPATERMQPCPGESIDRAASIIRTFAAGYGWAGSLPDFDHIPVLVAPDRATLEDYLRDLGELTGEAPAGLVAASLPGGIVIADVAGVQAVRPEYLAIDQGWIRLLAHEFAHLLHENLVGGKEELLGPRWFFEGFACLAAGQRLGRDFAGRPAAEVFEAVKVVGREQYPVYEAALRYFAAQVPLPQLVDHAGEDGFEAWLSGVLEPPPG